MRISGFIAIIPMHNHPLFAGRTLVLATMHSKEQVMAPLLQQYLGVQVVVPANFNTDQFGTFSGEIEREGTPYETALRKCIHACQLTGHSLAVASEGSFGPHPQLGFIPADDELVLLYDAHNQLEISARELTTATNFAGRQISSVREAQQFATAAGFPQHALILRAHEHDTHHVQKGITEMRTLLSAVEKRLEAHDSVYITTDMRAMYNPTRMQAIEKATRKLIEKANECCPACTTPGYTVTNYHTGLPCSLCGAPTRSVLSVVYTCSKCKHTDTVKYPKGKTNEDPMYCDWCNP
jgi:hypothetical protein